MQLEIIPCRLLQITTTKLLQILSYAGQKTERVIKFLCKCIQHKFFENIDTKTCYSGTKLGDK